MYNTNKPPIDELPTKAQLIRSTIIAAVAAVVILITVVLPAEYGIDPTRIGQTLGLTPIGEIKQQLSEEAENDNHSSRSVDKPPRLIGYLLNMLIPVAHAADTEATAQQWQEEVTFELAPGEGLEIKLKMNKDAQAEYLWIADGGRINYDLHADGDGESISYAKGRGVARDEGSITAAFDGVHGWFWRNRDKQAVTVTLYVRGDYQGLVR